MAGGKDKKVAKQPRITNRRASFQYELLERVEAGIVLKGSEVKSLRAGQASLEESYARVEEGELFLIRCHITPYVHAGGRAQPDPVRPRKLLLHAAELRKLIPKLELRGLTLVPLSIHFNERGIAKVELALARGKAAHDKRETIKRREQEREMRAAVKRR